jgi:meiotically up-regulated gene 157 (Mug157) protein
VKRLDATIKYSHNPKSEFLICGDINVDYLNDNNHKKQTSLLTTCTLSHTVNFPTGNQNYSNITIDNVFVDITKLSISSASPIINVPSDCDVQFLTVNNNVPTTDTVPLKQRTRELNYERIMQLQLQLQLATETWNSVYIDNATTNKFNSFLHTFLNIFEATFPLKYKSLHTNKNGRNTQGIKLSCECRKKLHACIPVIVMMP